jgi:hypothetical protein
VDGEGDTDALYFGKNRADEESGNESAGGFYVEARRRRDWEKMGARHARGERRREGGPISRQGTWSAEAGGGSVALSRKAKAGEMRSEGVRYGVGRNGPVALAA